MGRSRHCPAHTGGRLMQTVSLECRDDADGKPVCTLSGIWTLVHVAPQSAALQARLAAMAAKSHMSWDGHAIEALDSAGATLLWRAWGRRLPEVLILQPQHLRVFERLAAADKLPPVEPQKSQPFARLQNLGMFGLAGL